jgi:ketosteroid isomerase-like protein
MAVKRRHAGCSCSRIITLLAAVAAGAIGCATTSPVPDLEHLRREVAATETAFAATMAARDLEAFGRFLSEEAVFLNGGSPLRGKRAILDRWRGFFEAPAAPFSWKPDMVEVSASGGLAQSIGPVFSPDGTLTARFYSTWLREEDGVWRIVFDNGYDVCKDSLR